MIDYGVITADGESSSNLFSRGTSLSFSNKVQKNIINFNFTYFCVTRRQPPDDFLFGLRVTFMDI